MTTKIWPPPNEVEQAQIDDVIDNPFEEACDSCEFYPCCCDYCGDCDCDPCECDRCATCGYMDCECYDCYVVYSARVVVYVDSDGDVSKVTVSSDLDDPYEVEDESCDPVPAGPLRERALAAAANQDWPSWDIE